MLTVTPTGEVLGATIAGLDLAQPLSDSDFSEILRGLGQYGVLRFPDQTLESVEMKRCQVMATKIFDPDYRQAV